MAIRRGILVPPLDFPEAKVTFGPWRKRHKNNGPARLRGKRQPPRRSIWRCRGGGAHGAFTWGVLDRLLEDGRIGFDGISGTSAGAMNAAVLVDGWVRDGADGAREALENFWHAISIAAHASPIRRSPIDLMFGNWNLDMSPAYIGFDLMSRLVSPYAFNPLNINPLKMLVEENVDFDRIHTCSDTNLFISATNVHTGKVKVFTGDEITADSVMASACLPHLFQAVVIDDIPYWDGGYVGNPSLFPFHNSCSTDDLLLIQINPIERKSTPTSASEIMNRMNEISFNASLLKELRAIEFVHRLIEQGVLDGNAYSNVRLHRIDGGEDLASLQASSKFNAEWDFFVLLRDAGRNAASLWLDAHADKVGRESSLPIETVFS